MSASVEIIAPDIPAPRGHFSHAVQTATAIYVSGLLALDDQGQIQHPDDPVAQTQQIMSSLASILAAAAASIDDVVKLTIYVTDIEDRAAVGDARASFFGQRRPASTLVEVSSLAAPGAKVEIEAVVNLPGA